MSEQGLTGIAALEAEMRDRLAAKDARIASLEETVAKAFLRVKELEEALETFLEDCTEEAMEDWAEASDEEFVDLTAKIGNVRKAVALCHADASRADSPHRADGALQSDDGEAR